MDVERIGHERSVGIVRRVPADGNAVGVQDDGLEIDGRRAGQTGGQRQDGS